ncbi:UvrABC system protein A [Frankliniella fusca]|uniref:UvrABC system protein A n=1 Tax=Frankliniella fusca TaxID=407009 RepID=A0AAE1HSN0_9NEOP|nr:UvrABC system protein A [Frankliniella fusca]
MTSQGQEVRVLTTQQLINLCRNGKSTQIHSSIPALSSLSPGQPQNHPSSPHQFIHPVFALTKIFFIPGE